MKRFLALMMALTLLCLPLTGCTKNGNVSDNPNGSISSNPNDRQTDAASELMPSTSSRNDLENNNGVSGSTEPSENTNNSNGNGMNGTNGNGTNENGTNGNGTNGTNGTDNTEGTVGAPQSRGIRRF